MNLFKLDRRVASVRCGGGFVVTILPFGFGAVHPYGDLWEYDLRILMRKSGVKEWAFLKRHVFANIWLVDRKEVQTWPVAHIDYQIKTYIIPIEKQTVDQYLHFDIIPVQVNGILRDKIEVPKNATESDMINAALCSEKVRRFAPGGCIEKIVVVPKWLINVITND